ncbi:MAG TPA: hypothetical protein DCY13_09190, partial [Verrucomicrobiales bacterium]|nr:hypothetical protein [Verrucomicrobiales bacterium]
MKRPLGGVAILFSLGIVMGSLVSLPVFGWLALAGAGALLGAFVRVVPRLWLTGLLLFAGAANLTLHRAVISPHDLRTISPAAPELVTVFATVRRVELREQTSRDGEESLRLLAVVQVDGLRQSDGTRQPAHGEVLATTRSGAELDLRAGQRIELHGVLKPPEGPFAPGMFDYRSHLAWRGIHRTLEFEGARDLRVLQDATRSLPVLFQAWGRAALQRGLPGDDEFVPLLWAMSLGWKTSLTDEVAEPFMRSGTMHLFAISGLHVGLICGILVALLRFVRVPRGGVGLVVIPALWFFAAATGWQPSAVRATIMLGIVIAGWSLNRPGDLLNSLAAAALIILAWDPRQLFHAGFQLSFVVV